MRSVPGAIANGLSGIKVRHLVSLSVEHVINSTSNALLVPEISFTAFLRPWAVFVRPLPINSQLTSGICFECHECPLCFQPTNRDDGVSVIRSHIDRMKTPLSLRASFTYREVN